MVISVTLLIGWPTVSHISINQGLGEIQVHKHLKQVCHERENSALTLELPEASAQGRCATLPSGINLKTSQFSSQ